MFVATCQRAGCEHLRLRHSPSCQVPDCRCQAYLTPFTPQELKVLALLAEGLCNKEVAAKLSLSTKTVGTHVNNMKAKSGIRGPRIKLILYAISVGAIPPVHPPPT